MQCDYVVTVFSSSLFGFIIIGFKVTASAGLSFTLLMIFIVTGLIFGSGTHSFFLLILLMTSLFLTSPMSASLRMMLHLLTPTTLPSVPTTTLLWPSVSSTTL